MTPEAPPSFTWPSQAELSPRTLAITASPWGLQHQSTALERNRSLEEHHGRPRLAAEIGEGG